MAELSVPRTARQFSLKEADTVLSSDAKVSGVSAENAASQPMKRWYGSHDHGQVKLSGTQNRDEQPNQQAPMGTFLKGKGTTIAILDSGINTKHAAFTGRISPESKSFVSDSIEDVLGHGTLCAGLACGSKNTILLDNVQHTIEGVVPEATVMVCKVVPDGTGEANIGAVIQALNHILQYNEGRSLSVHGDRVSVVSMSWGMLGFHHLLSKKIQEVISNDVIVVCAASNYGAATTQPIVYPARLGHVLCIGSCDRYCKPSNFSPRGRELDFLTYGESLWGPSIKPSLNASSYASYYASGNGTSFATAVVAGLVCQIIEDLRNVEVVYEVSLLEELHNVWGMREIMKHMSTTQGVHSQDEGFGSLVPLKYFKKTTNEKKTVLSEILFYPDPTP